MSRFDFSPLYRSAIGFDHLAGMIEKNSNSSTGYPPYNIEALEENTYRISMAVAGFSEAELDITSLENELLVKGSKAEQKEKRRYLHQGIAERNFERKFQLADYVNVVSAEVENGLLHIVLRKDLPEAKKPRQIEVVNRKLQS